MIGLIFYIPLKHFVILSDVPHKHRFKTCLKMGQNSCHSTMAPVADVPDIPMAWRSSRSWLALDLYWAGAMFCMVALMGSLWGYSLIMLNGIYDKLKMLLKCLTMG
jgi:hypothetical protein